MRSLPTRRPLAQARPIREEQRIAWTRTLAALIAAAILGGSTARADDLIVYHDWSSPAELAALNVMRAAVEANGDRWIPLAIPHNSVTPPDVISLMEAGASPNVFLQMKPDIYRQLNAANQILQLDRQFVDNGLLDHLPQVVRDAITIDGRILKVPATLHADATIYYNRAVAEAVGIDPRNWTSLEAMWADFPAIHAAGYLPLAMGEQSWQVGYLTHTLVASLGGHGLYRGLYGANFDIAALDQPELLDVFGWLRRFQQAADPQAPGRDWNVATNMVITGQALMQIQGDWMKGEWRAAGRQLDTDYGCMLLPGARALPVTIDSWGLLDTQSASTEAAERAFAQAMVDPHNQAAFAAAKGSTPIRLDAQGKIDRCSRGVLAALDQPDYALPTPHLTAPAERLDQIWATANAFWQDESMLPQTAVIQLKQKLKGLH